MTGRRIVLCLLLALAACAETGKEGDRLTLSSVDYGDLAGWNSDHQSEALPALARSCGVIARKADNSAIGVAGTAHDWRAPCAAAASLPQQNDAAARAFFEQYFRPYAASGRDGGNGLFTGYYEAELRGSATPNAQFRIPLYAKPADLIGVDLGLFRDSLKGQHIAGKVDAAQLVPYDDRAQIVKNGLTNRAQTLLWVDDPVDAFFLEIQGSGRVRMQDGSIMQVGYDGANGRAYVAIGKALADMNALQKPVTMQSIRGWLAAHLDRAQEIMNLNPSYVFFREIRGDGPIGAQGVALTPLRSIAVDPSFVPLGVPLWLDTQDGGGRSIERLVIAQDTGGAIKGAVRGDLFWGGGDQAAQQAGLMQSRGHYYLLLPKTVAHAGE